MTVRASVGFRVAAALVVVGTVAALTWLIHPAPGQTPWCASCSANSILAYPLAPRESLHRIFTPDGDHLDFLRVRFTDDGAAPGCAAELTLRRAPSAGGDPHERTLSRWMLQGEQLLGMPEVGLPRGVARELRAGDPLDLEVRRLDDDGSCALAVVAEDGAPTVVYGASEHATLWGGRRFGAAPSPWTAALLLLLAVTIAWRGPGPDRVAAALAPNPPLAGAARLDWCGWDTAAAITLVCAVIAAVILHGRYPITWDEPDHALYGRHVLAYYTSGFADSAALTFRNDYLYGGAYDLLGALCTRMAPGAPFRALHLLGALAGIGGAAACWWTARTLAGSRAGLWALWLLLATPIYVGHAFNNPKDGPFAAATALALLWLVRTVQRWPAVPWWTTAALGVSIGLAAGVRVGGLVLGFYLALVTIGHVVLTLLQPGPLRSHLRPALAPVLRVALPATALGYVVMLACWPWAQHGPLTRPWLALGEMSHFAWEGLVLYRGHYASSLDLPPSYAPTQLLLQLPEVVLPAVALASVAGLAALARGGGRATRGAVAWAVVALAAGFPLVYVVARSSVLYDGARHLLFVLPPLVVIAAAGLDRAWAAASRSPGWVRVLVGLVLALSLAHPALVGARLFPYPHCYYNRFVGGPAGAAGRHVLDDWRSANAEAVGLAVEHLRSQGELVPGSPPIRLHAWGKPPTATAYFPPGLVWEDDSRRADLVIVPARMPYCQAIPYGEVVGVVTRMGVPLTVVFDRRGVEDAQTEVTCATAW